TDLQRDFCSFAPHHRARGDHLQLYAVILRLGPLDREFDSYSGFQGSLRDETHTRAAEIDHAARSRLQRDSPPRGGIAELQVHRVPCGAAALFAWRFRDTRAALPENLASGAFLHNSSLKEAAPPAKYWRYVARTGPVPAGLAANQEVIP